MLSEDFVPVRLRVLDGRMYMPAEDVTLLLHGLAANWRQHAPDAFSEDSELTMRGLAGALDAQADDLDVMMIALAG